MEFSIPVIDKTQAKFFRERWQAVVQIESVEAKATSIEQRWLQLNRLMCLAEGLALPVLPDGSEMLVYQRWAKLKQTAV